MSHTLLDMRERRGLPEHLKVLLDKYPRTGWPAKDQMASLTQFWLDRHLMFRRLIAQLAGEAQAFSDNPNQAREFGQRTPRLAGFLIQQLHGHHQVEDHHYFPLLVGYDDRLAQGFSLLDLDHQALDLALQDYQSAAQDLLSDLSRQPEAQPEAQPASLAAYEGQLSSLERWVERHLFDEEELIVPILLHYGEPSF